MRGENSNAGGYLDSDMGLANDIAHTVLDDGGVNSFDFGSATVAQYIDFRQEAISSIYGVVGNLVIARGTGIENVISGSGADTIMGNDANNVIARGSGADTIIGRQGNDTVFGGAVMTS
ncbi:M10 family metallopeptidase C-terminal domain-containing protein [bacterium]|nr:M10 family metallopeptidase C-terminal domain-containing protein [bacterium]